MQSFLVYEIPIDSYSVTHAEEERFVALTTDLYNAKLTTQDPMRQDITMFKLPHFESGMPVLSQGQ